LPARAIPIVEVTARLKKVKNLLLLGDPSRYPMAYIVVRSQRKEDKLTKRRARGSILR